MKKILFSIAIASLTLIAGCEGPEGPQGPAGTTTTIVGQTYEIQNVNFTPGPDGYFIERHFTDFAGGQVNYDSDVVLIYRLATTVDATTPVWQQMPRTLFLTGGQEVDYDFDFTRSDFIIYAGGNFDLTGTSYIVNQTFRIVVVPSDFVGKHNTADYNEVRDALKLRDTDFKKI